MRLVQTFAILLALASAGTSTAEADRWSAELRLGAALPTDDVGEVELDAGPGFEANVGYRFQPHLSVYGGWDWLQFGTNADLDLEETGYAFGLRFTHPIAEGSQVAYQVRLGGVYDHLELENTDGDLVADSGHELGWEAGLGVPFEIGESWSLTPGVRYRSLSVDLDHGDGTESVDLSAFILDVGVSREF